MAWSLNSDVLLGQEPRTLHEQVLAQLPLPIAVRNWHGRYLFANEAYARTRGKPLSSIGHWVSKTIEADREVIDSRRPRTATEANQLHGLHQTTHLPITLPDGTRAVLEMAVDITHLRQTDNQRRQVEDEIVQTQHRESLGTLAAEVAHDFNNLLVVIMGHAGMMQDDPRVGPLATNHLAQIETTSQRCADLSRQLLAYSGRGQPDLLRMDLSGLVNGMRYILEHAIGGICEMQMDLAEGLWIEGDPTAIQQIVLSLAVNAADSYGSDGGIVSILTRIQDGVPPNPVHDFEHALPAGNYVCLEIIDQGAGMSPSTQAKAFDPYFTTGEDHRGLGLSAVASLVRRHEGAVRMDSLKGHGTRIRVLLPQLESPGITTDRSEKS